MEAYIQVLSSIFLSCFHVSDLIEFHFLIQEYQMDMEHHFRIAVTHPPLQSLPLTSMFYYYALILY